MEKTNIGTVVVSVIYEINSRLIKKIANKNNKSIIEC